MAPDSSDIDGDGDGDADVAPLASPPGPTAVALTRTITVDGQLSLFDIPFEFESVMKTESGATTVRFTLRIGDMTLGQVLRELVTAAGGGAIELGQPWNVIDTINLRNFAFEVEFSDQQTRYGLSYSDIGLDLTFVQIDKIEVFSVPATTTQPNKRVDVRIFGTFLGIDFTKQPISWDALKERPPSTPDSGSKKFRLDYLGLGQHVTLRNVSNYKTVGATMDALRGTYAPVPEGAASPMSAVPELTFDESAGWLVGAQFSVLETFDFAGVWNLPQLAGARIKLRGERAKSLAGFEFEILYRRVSDTLGVYHLELVLPDVLRRFQAGIASVTLPVITLDVYTDGGFLVDLGFPRNLDFSKSFSIEMIIMGVPVTGSLGLYFGVLSQGAVPSLPSITGGSFSTVVVAGAGARIGVGKSINVGILEAGLFVGIEGLLEGVLAFYEPAIPTESQGTYYRVKGMLQLTGHIWGSVNFVIVKGKVDVYAYVRAEATFEAYRASLVVFEAGVRLDLTITVGWGWFSFDIKLSFSATIRHEITIGSDQTTPWHLRSGSGTTLAERYGGVAYRRLPNGQIIADSVVRSLLDGDSAVEPRQLRQLDADEKVPLHLYFQTIATLGSPAPDEKGSVYLVSMLMASLERGLDGGLSPIERYVAAVLEWGLDEVQHLLGVNGGEILADEVRLSELHLLADDLAGVDPRLPIDLTAVDRFLAERVDVTLVAVDGPDAPTRLTPFPMLPNSTLTTSTGHHANFQDGPVCSTAYQRFIDRYFDWVDQPGSNEADAIIEGDDPAAMTMTALIFVDLFRLMLGQITDEAIERMRTVRIEARGADLMNIAHRTGLDHAAGIARLARGNADSEAFILGGSAYYIAAKGIRIDRVANLSALAGAWDLPLLSTAVHVRRQQILLAGSVVHVPGGRHLLADSDTKESILQAFGIASWEEVEAANPFFDWSVPQWFPVSPPGVDGADVDNGAPDPPYPTLVLPAGETIALPIIGHLVRDGDTLQGIADLYGTTLAQVVAAGSEGDPLPLGDDGIAWQGVCVSVRSGETIQQLADRMGIPATNGSSELFASLLHDAEVLPAGTILSVPSGRYTFKRHDTLLAVALGFQTTPDRLREANGPDNQWRFVPRPGSSEELPLGVQITLPAIPAYAVQGGETFASISKRFGLDDATALVALNTGATLAAFSEVVLAPMRRTMPDSPMAMSTVARQYALDPVQLTLANQGSPSGQGSDVALGTVVVHDCEIIGLSDLIDQLGQPTPDEPSALAAVASSAARFLLAGLRLPLPDHVAEALAEEASSLTALELRPLYELTGQQWAAPTAPDPEQDWAQLTINADSVLRVSGIIAAPGRRTDAEPNAVRAPLGPVNAELVEAFWGALASGAGIESTWWAVTPYPAADQVAMQQPLGAPTVWTRPTPISFVTAPEIPAQEVLLVEVPRALREMLPAVSGANQNLDVVELVADPATGRTGERRVADVGWATRLDIRIRQIYTHADSELPMESAYEVLSATAAAQADLVGLRAWLDGPGSDATVELHVLFPSGPMSSQPGTLRSDGIAADQLSRVALLKSNLSTFSRPPGAQRLTEATEGVTAAATLGQPLDFLELLWQVSVTNSGGFFLDYGVPLDRPGLPDDLFLNGPFADISILAVVRQASSPDAPTIAPRRFHNALVVAENLATKSVPLVVVATTHQVAPEGESLQAIAAAYPGLTAAQLAVLNESTPNLVRPQALTMPSASQAYNVRPGDDLLTIALSLGVTVEALAEQYATSLVLLTPLAQLHVSPTWANVRNRVDPSRGGFRILRAPPPPVVPASDDLQIAARIQRLFNVLGYALADSVDSGFRATTSGLPIAPSHRDDRATNQRFAVGEGDEQPWVYSVIMPIAAAAKTHAEPALPDIDPYGGLGERAVFEARLHDPFGNLLPADPVSIPWEQRYRDPLVPLHAWPSVTLSYDVEQRPNFDAPEVVVRIKFAPAGYRGTIGVPFCRVRQSARSDQERWALVYYQVADRRTVAKLTTTLRPGDDEIVSNDQLAAFARRSYDFLGAVTEIAPVVVVAESTDSLRSIALLYQLTTTELAVHIGFDPCVLAVGRMLMVPLLAHVMPNTTLDEILRGWGEAPSPFDVGEWNSRVRLTADTWLSVDGALIKTVAGSTLASLADGAVTPGMIATENRTVPGLFLQDETLFLGAAQARVERGDSLASIAAAAEISVEVLAAANADAEIFAPDAEIEVPLHVELPPGLPGCVTVAEGDSLATLTARIEGAIRDVLSANADTAGLLAVTSPPTYMVYPVPSPPRPADGAAGESEIISEEIRPNDTMSTITRRFATRLGDPSLQPADVGSFPANADNTALLRAGALVLRPPNRLLVSMRIPEEATHDLVIGPLEVCAHLERPDDLLIEPTFRRSADVRHVSSPISPRLSSAFSATERSSPVEFARQFQRVFPQFRLATGPSTVRSADTAAADQDGSAAGTRLMVMRWDRHGLHASVSGPACFFAPRPLLTELWHGTDVPIRPYERGKPLSANAPVATTFAAADLERWAASLFARIDALLDPDMSLAMRALAPDYFRDLVNAKQRLAEAVAARVDLILEPDAAAPEADAASAREQYLQQLLVRLSETFRGGIVVQFEADVVAPTGPGWSRDVAPRLLCAVETASTLISTSEPTLDELGARFQAPPLLLASILARTENILDVGKVVPVGTMPTITATSTIAQIADAAGVDLSTLVAAVHGLPGFLAPGAGIPLVGRSYVSGVDDTFASVLDHLAVSLTSRDRYDAAIEVLDAMNGSETGLFIADLGFKREVAGKTFTWNTGKDDTMRTAAASLGYSGDGAVVDFVMDYLVTSPLLAPNTPYRYLALFPPSSLSAAKITLCSDSAARSKLNTVFVTSAPDEASSVSMQLKYRVQNLEYNIADVEAHAPGAVHYQASDWLTFVDWEYGQPLGELQIPIPDRQFPIPPTVLRHDAVAQVRDGHVDPRQLGKVAVYDYTLAFAFDAAAQDDVFYVPDYLESDSEVPIDGGEEPAVLPQLLAQYGAIDAALWADLCGLRGWAASSVDDAPWLTIAMQIFTELARDIAEQWSTWQPVPSVDPSPDRFVLRRHRHPEGADNVVVSAVEQDRVVSKGRSLPTARMLDEPSTRRPHDPALEPAAAEPRPLPRTQSGNRYEVIDPNLNVLRERGAWGRIEVTRNGRLVQGRSTTPGFVLNIRKVRASRPALPSIRVTQRLDVANELGYLRDRLTLLVTNLFFPDRGTTASQRIGLTLSFARQITERAGDDGLTPPSRTMLAPIATTPAFVLDASSLSDGMTPERLSQQLADMLNGWLVDRGLAPREHWAFAVRLFGSRVDGPTQAPLMELLDLRVRMADE